jgi:hypothetical protein
MLLPTLAWMLPLVLVRCVVSLPCLCSGVPGQVVVWLRLTRRLLHVWSAWA